ncbi:MAG: hypothetical protein CMJ78_03965 [Planctomycetaceae bacterium]|nr:hypothetical protein [Planctomycetaceae bacterium]
MATKVLLIEDSLADAVFIKRILAKAERFTLQILHEETLALGLERIDTSEPDVVLLDLTLPDSLGMETYLKVSKAAADLPVVVLSGLDDETLAMQAVHLGAQDYLVKGKIEPSLLSRALMYAVERKEASLALQRANDELEQRVRERTSELEKMQERSRQQQEELAHASRLSSLGEMASGLAHELNQPLMAIVGFSSSCHERLKSSAANTDELSELLSDITAEATRAGNIIKRLRRMVQKRASQESTFSMSDLVRETVDFLKREIENYESQLNLEFEAASDLVTADRIQIQQVLMNLATNGLQAMSETDVGSRLLSISVSNSTDDVDVDVTNTGPRLSDEDMERLFQPFYTTKVEGLGLGLSITRSIVEGHHGSLTVVPGDVEGMTFRFSLPAEKTAADLRQVNQS